jgi:hypothetical protein
MAKSCHLDLAHGSGFCRIIFCKHIDAEFCLLLSKGIEDGSPEEL